MLDRTNKYNYLSLKFYFVEFYFWSILLNLTIDINGCSASIQVTVRVVLQCSAMVVELSISPFNSSPCPLLIPRACSNSCPLSQWCHPTISSSVVPFSSHLSLSQHQSLFKWVNSSHQVAKVLEFQLQYSNEYSGLISFRVDWLDLLAVRATFKSLLQHYSSKASILWCSAFFIVQLSHPYMTTGKTIALTRWTFLGKIMSLLFNMVSRLVTTFLPRSKYFLISWLHSPSAVILEPPKIKSVTVSTVSHLFAKKWWDWMPWS